MASCKPAKKLRAYIVAELECGQKHKVKGKKVKAKDHLKPDSKAIASLLDAVADVDWGGRG